MSMTNFLPWRRQRRVRCLRFWGVLFVATWLLILMGVFSLRMNPLVMTRALHIQLAGMQSVQQALVSRTRSGTETPMPAPAPQRRDWQPVLESFAGVMPSQVWLTELRYQPPSLMLTGYAATLPALSALRDGLGKMAGFTAGPTGELQQDDQGALEVHLSSAKRGLIRGNLVRTLVRKQPPMAGAVLVSERSLSGEYDVGHGASTGCKAGG